MHPLVQLVIWILETLFGEPEKGPDATPTPHPGDVKPRRGPYSYGDEGGKGPKSLEEILAEVRREAAQRQAKTQAQTKTPAPPKQTPGPVPVKAPRAPRPRPATSGQPAQDPPPAPRQTERIEDRRLRSSIDSIPETQTAMSPGRDAPRPISVVSAESAVPMRAPPVARPGPVPIGISSAPATPERPAEGTPQQADGAARGSAPPQLLILDALRRANAQGRLNAAREGFVLMEVLGPPRSRRPHARIRTVPSKRVPRAPNVQS